MKQLTVGRILNVIKNLQDNGMSIKEISRLPVYIGDDDELNGIHTGWYCELLDEKEENAKDLIEMINDDRNNISFDSKAILIS